MRCVAQRVDPFVSFALPGVSRLRVRDVFGEQRLSERRYTSAQIDVPTWADDIEADFQQWREEQNS